MHVSMNIVPLVFTCEKTAHLSCLDESKDSPLPPMLTRCQAAEQTNVVCVKLYKDSVPMYGVVLGNY